MMHRYILDADTISYAIRGQGAVGARILEHRPSELCISSITLAELRFGAEAKRSQKLKRAIRAFVRNVEVVPFDEAAADEFAVVAAALARRGRPIGTLDTLLAAHALSLGATVVTNNTKHFSQVPDLAVENWA
jgi:tRNA(fMet)-specific endonuclease VapC